MSIVLLSLILFLHKYQDWLKFETCTTERVKGETACEPLLLK